MKTLKTKTAALIYLIDLYDRIFLKHVRSIEVVENHLSRLGRDLGMPKIFLHNIENVLPTSLETRGRDGGFEIRTFQENRAVACADACEAAGCAGAVIVPAAFPFIEAEMVGRFARAFVEDGCEAVTAPKIPIGLAPFLLSTRLLRGLDDAALADPRNILSSSPLEGEVGRGVTPHPASPSRGEEVTLAVQELGVEPTLLGDQGMFDAIVNILLEGKDVREEFGKWKVGHEAPAPRPNRDGFYFSADDQLTRQEAKRSRFYLRLSTYDVDKKSWPFSFSHENRTIRYQFVPAKNTAGCSLIVRFHGHGPNSASARSDALDEYHQLMPWDFFGYRRQGSWFWGEKGDNFVERLIRTLVLDVCRKHGIEEVYAYGESMGGFAAIYHALRYGYAGVYAGMPQIDLLRLMQKDNFHTDNPYAYLKGPGGKDYPDLLDLARQTPNLPPLFIDQHLRDAVNPFDQHALKLIEIYNEQSAWYGLSVEPASGHFMKGTFADAVRFFDRIRSLP
ncbi:hypothetical protein HY522_01850 [bacterium]|nr:hypothetical protein [bacterium]